MNWKPYRVWINQPSGLQPHHDLHGMRGLAIDLPDHVAEDGKVYKFSRFFPNEGKITSIEVNRLAITKLKN